MNKKVYAAPNLIIPNRPLVFDEEVCNGCNRCLETCRSDVMIPNPKKGKPPILMYPDECWYCGCCVERCSRFLKGAIELVLPLTQQVGWKRKETGETYKVGMANAPAPNTRPPVGGWNPKP
jgi:NAD-dependent dihydropyrimidine dehydrogenase PreA subunit